jgi:hypothetical protein
VSCHMVKSRCRKTASTCGGLRLRTTDTAICAWSHTKTAGVAAGRFPRESRLVTGSSR